MSSIQISISCSRCNFLISQEIITDSMENYIYCPSCDNVFMYNSTEDTETDTKDTDTNAIDACQDHLYNFTEDTDTNAIDACQNQHVKNFVTENLEKAYNEIPHTFIRTEAIFLKGHINGHEIDFLLDTGAEMSIIPVNIIQACGLENILDTHYSGIMKGVGEDKMLGKLHYVEVILECGLYPCSFSVCSNNNLHPILGIDMMYNLGISIDFKKKQIHFDNGCSMGFINRSHALTPK